jgi:outer membrane protein assembly factor BamA
LRTILLAALLLSVGTRVTAQASSGGGLDLDADYWFDVFYPKVFYTPIEGLTGGAYYAIVQPLRSADFLNPHPYRISFSVDGQLSTSGSRFIKLEARAPGLSNGWRFSAGFVARRRAKDNYFGLGNQTVFDTDNVTDDQPDFYRAIRTQYIFRAEVQRDLIGPLRIVGGVKVDRWQVTQPEGPSLFAIDLANDPTMGVATNDVSARIGLVVDTRDDEVAPTNGIVVGAGVGVADAGIAGDLTYTRSTVNAQGYWSPNPLFTVAARAVGQVMGGTPRFGSYYLIEGGTRFYEGLGGSATHRALPGNRFLGRDKLFGNLEARYTLSAIPTLYRISLVGFLDAGRVFETEDFRLTTEDLKVGGGTGLIIQIGRAGIVGFTVGVGPDGIESDFHTRWTF